MVSFLQSIVYLYSLIKFLYKLITSITLLTAVVLWYSNMKFLVMFVFCMLILIGTLFVKNLKQQKKVHYYVSKEYLKRIFLVSLLSQIVDHLSINKTLSFASILTFSFPSFCSFSVFFCIPM